MGQQNHGCRAARRQFFQLVIPNASRAPCFILLSLPLDDVALGYLPPPPAHPVLFTSPSLFAFGGKCWQKSSDQWDDILNTYLVVSSFLGSGSIAWSCEWKRKMCLQGGIFGEISVSIGIFRVQYCLLELLSCQILPVQEIERKDETNGGVKQIACLPQSKHCSTELKSFENTCLK